MILVGIIFVLGVIGSKTSDDKSAKPTPSVTPEAAVAVQDVTARTFPRIPVK
jgi:hypothetical protein